MTAKEIITYLLNFDLDTEVVFLDSNAFVHSLTVDSRETYHGNNGYNKTPIDIKLQSAIIKYQIGNDSDTNRYTNIPNNKFKNGEYVRIINGKHTDKVGVVFGIPRSDGGQVYNAPGGTVCVLLGTFSDNIPACYLEKITKEEYIANKNEKR